MKRFFLALCILLFSSGCSSPCESGSCIRILFLGNSYTFVNDLPATLTALAKSGGHKIETGISAEGGMTLANHVDSANTANQLTSSKWDIVVLQEQSQIPSVKQMRMDQMYPAARKLVPQIEAVGARPLFFITWGHRNGWPENGLTTYESMQAQINRGYMNISYELNAEMSPIGFAWEETVKTHPEINLWQDDGSHPTAEGTYLAACVFYATLFRESPEGLSYHANISKENATILQKIAADIVLNNLSQWNIK
ncbi:MAG: hypothetical protein U0Z26_01930 [Anaerolineales bacterium]